MSVDISKQLASIVNATITLHNAADIYIVTEDDYKLGDIGGYLIDIITGTFGHENRIPIYYALRNLSSVEVPTIHTSMVTHDVYDRSTIYDDTYYVLRQLVTLTELDDELEPTGIIHAFSTNSNYTNNAWKEAANYVKAHTGVNFNLHVEGALSYQYNTLPTDYQGCTNLIRVRIDWAPTTIGMNAFRGCTGLQYCEFRSGANTLGAYCFYGCTSLKTVGLSGSLQSIGNYAFSGCAKLHDVRAYNDGSTSTEYFSYNFTIGTNAFYNCVELITIPDYFASHILSIGEYAFAECRNLKSIGDMPYVYYIGAYAFYKCFSLETFGELGKIIGRDYSGTKIQYLYDYTFVSCFMLKNVYGLDNIQYLNGRRIFNGCSSLERIYFGTIFKGQVSSITVSYNFRGCVSLKNVDFMQTMTQYRSDEFSNCWGLTSVTTGNTVTTIPSRMFNDCFRLRDVVIGNSVTSIGDSAFSGCHGLKNLTIGSSVTSIGSLAFSYCYDLETVDIPSSVTNIGTNAFLMTSVYGAIPQLSKIIIHGKSEGDISGAPWGAPSTCVIEWTED